MLIKAEDLVEGRWPEVLLACGVSKDFLINGRNGPCPFCNGKDRYRWTNKNGGLYVCSGCTDSKYRNGFDFLMRHLGVDFRGAAEHVKQHFNVTGSRDDAKIVERLRSEAPKVFKPDPQKALDRMSRQWNSSREVCFGDPVHLHLTSRVPGLLKVPGEIRYHPGLEYWMPSSSPDGRPTLLGCIPAMIIRGFDPDDNFVQLHKTFLTMDGNKANVPAVRKCDVGIGSNCYAFRIGEPAADLGVGEGIETALASMVLKGIPVWPCHSNTIMENFMVPRSALGVVRRTIIFSDSDQTKNNVRAGQRSAEVLADRLKKAGFRSMIARPAKLGTDFDDLIRR
jgi:putative DNA primase/helicase